METTDGRTTPASELAGDPGRSGRGLVDPEAQRVECVTRGEDDVVGLGEVVVFSGEPEDGDRIRRLGPLDDGGSFVEGEKGSAEEGDLLAGDDGACTLAEALDVG